MGYPTVTFPDGTTCRSGPNCKRHGDKHSLYTQASKHATTQIKENPLAHKTPVDVDTKLAEIYNRYYAELAPNSERRTRIERYKMYNDPSYRYYRASDAETLASNIAHAEEAIAKSEEEARKILAESAPYEAEWIRRGRWTRAFLVDNGNGHVHRSMGCSTCFPTTQFTWLPEFSGRKETEIVEEAGSSACTTCYPSAPVDVLRRASRIENPARRTARIAREEAKAARDKAAAEKAITTPEGNPLQTENSYGVIKTARTAEIQAVEARVTVLAQENGQYNITSESVNRERRSFEILLAALAHKHGRTMEDEREYLESKAVKKWKKEWVNRR